MNDSGIAQLWIQYSYPDPENASVLQTADSRSEAVSDDDLFPGMPWYRYDVTPDPEGEGDGSLSNPDGPHTFTEL